MPDAGQADPATEPRRLHDRLVGIRDEVLALSAARLAVWEPCLAREAFRASAANLAGYLALREQDLRPLQPGLAALGLSSLGRCEAHVRPTLDAVIATLARISGAGAPGFLVADDFARGGHEIAASRDALFGAGAGGPATRIMATLPTEAAEASELILDLVRAGVDCVRINCAHDGPEVWRRMIGGVRAAERETGLRVPVSMDLAGPKVRLRGVKDKGVKLFRGDRLSVAAEPSKHGHTLGLSHPELMPLLTLGVEVWIDDGKLRTRVVERTEDKAVLEVTGVRDKGAKLKPDKGVAIPGVDLAIPALTKEDLATLDFVVAEADIVAFSFVQRPEDVRQLLDEIDVRRGAGQGPAVLLKIETAQAVRNLPELIVTAGSARPVAVMIARGDLAVSIGFERLSEMQDEILWLCEAARVPVVWATQVLDGLLHEGLATRAEATDAAMGQRAECVMLNKGPHLLEAVRFLDSVLGRMERHQSKKFVHLGPLGAWRHPAP